MSVRMMDAVEWRAGPDKRPPFRVWRTRLRWAAQLTADEDTEPVAALFAELAEMLPDGTVRILDGFKCERFKADRAAIARVGNPAPICAEPQKRMHAFPIKGNDRNSILGR